MSLFSVAASAQQMTDSLRVYFRQGYSAFDPKFRDNKLRVDAFVSHIREFQKKSESFEILSVTYKAGASPEGTLAINKAISAKRSLNLTGYLRGHLSFADNTLHVEDVVEDWEGLSGLVSASDMPHKEEVMALMSAGLESSELKSRLQRLYGGSVWKYMNEKFFPELRAFNVYVQVGVRNPELGAPEIADSEPLQEELFPVLDDSLSVPRMQMPQEEPVSEWTRKLRIKTNSIGWAMSMTNVAVEVDLARHVSFQLPIYYSAVDYFSRELKFRTFAVQPEFRWWFDKPQGLFLGAHFGTAWFNFATHGDWRIQTGYGDRLLWGGGLATGYRMPLSKRHPRWEVEFSLGAGVYDVWYDRFYNEKNGPKEGTYHTTFVGIDHAAVSFSYSFDLKRRRGR